MGPDKDLILRGPKVDLNCTSGIGEVIFEKMLQYRDSVALVDAETKVSETFSELLKRSVAVALALRKRGLAPTSDVISMVELTTRDSFPVMLGTLFAGCVVNVLDAGWTSATVVPNQLPKLKPKIIFCHHSVEDLVKKTVENNKIETEIIAYDGPSKHENKTFEDFMKESCNDQDIENYRPTKIENPTGSTAAILCTSGSTGAPKGVMTSHEVLYQILAPLKNADLSSMTLFTQSGLSWGSGLFMLLAGLSGGARRVYTKLDFTEENVLRIIQEFKPAMLLLSCYQISLLSSYTRVGDYDLSSAQLIFAVGSRLSARMVERMMSLLAGNEEKTSTARLIISYGLTECMGGANTLTCPEYRPGTVGFVSVNCELKIVDPETGANLGPDKDGDIYLRGPTMIGYHGDQEATRAVLDPVQGWLKTGDIGHYDQDGYVYVTDRSKEIAKYRGANINPTDIEDVLNCHPSVRSSAVVSVSHDDTCDLMVAFVELKTEHKNKGITEEELEEYANGKLEDYQKLRGGVYFMDELPILSHGKIAKADVKKIALDMSEQIIAKYKLRSQL